MRGNAEVFDHIYQHDMWRGRKHGSRSGQGSVGEWLAFSVGALTARVDLSDKHVVDVGCGDFSFGACIAPHAALYTGVDVSNTIIDANQAAHSSEDVEFVRLDAASGDDLPKGDVFVIRQVLQHLPNEDIKAVMDAVMRCEPQGVAVFEHVPDGQAEPNADLPTSGPFTRSIVDSWVDLNAGPFHLPFKPVASYPHPETPKDKSHLAFYWWEPD